MRHACLGVIGGGAVSSGTSPGGFDKSRDPIEEKWTMRRIPAFLFVFLALCFVVGGAAAWLGNGRAAAAGVGAEEAPAPEPASHRLLLNDTTLFNATHIRDLEYSGAWKTTTERSLVVRRPAGPDARLEFKLCGDQKNVSVPATAVLVELSDDVLYASPSGKLPDVGFAGAAANMAANPEPSVFNWSSVRSVTFSGSCWGAITATTGGDWSRCCTGTTSNCGASVKETSGTTHNYTFPCGQGGCVTKSNDSLIITGNNP
jgi:hypothetical protein